MRTADIDLVCNQLDSGSDNVTIQNISEVVLVIPRRILSRAGSDARCFWEASCPKTLNPQAR
jgi:hypothetical protein